MAEVRQLKQRIEACEYEEESDEEVPVNFTSDEKAMMYHISHNIRMQIK